MKTLQIHDKTFRIFIDETTILERVNALANRIEADYSEEPPLFIAVLNGSFIFAADLLKRVQIPCEIQFVKITNFRALGDCFCMFI